MKPKQEPDDIERARRRFFREAHLSAAQAFIAGYASAFAIAAPSVVVRRPHVASNQVERAWSDVGGFFEFALNSFET